MTPRASQVPTWPRPGLEPVERYFGPVYHQLYSEHLIPGESADAEIAFLLAALRPRRAAQWLDAPCGYGRHLVRLRAARPDLRVTGLERQIGFLQSEKRLRGSAANADMRWLPFRKTAFDAVLNLFNSFGYYPARREGIAARRDDADVVREWARVLKPGGRLAMDLSNRRPLLRTVKESPRIKYWAGEYDVEEMFNWDARAQCLINSTHWRWQEGAQRTGYCLRLYTPLQLRRLLEAAGFEPRQWFGDFTGSAFDSYSSDRMIVIARKAK